MNATNWSFEDAKTLLGNWGEVDVDACVDDAYSASIKAGYRAGASSGNPLSFLRDFFNTEIVPCIKDNTKLFTATIKATVSKMHQEGFAGPVSQTVFVHAVVTDAIVKVTSTAPSLAWGELSTADWVAIGVCFMMWLRSDESESLKELLVDIDTAIRDDG